MPSALARTVNVCHASRFWAPAVSLIAWITVDDVDRQRCPPSGMKPPRGGLPWGPQKGSSRLEGTLSSRANWQNSWCMKSWAPGLIGGIFALRAHCARTARYF